MYRFKRAETADELEQVFRLNHDVFADELRQYRANPTARLIDKFHEKNLYFIALTGDQVVGMVAAHDQPPFSIADRLRDPRVLDDYGRLIEVRLLAIDPRHRSRMLLARLWLELYEFARRYDTIIISGYLHERAMYHRLGFRDLGPPVASGDAEFIPMAVRVADLAERQTRWRSR